METGNPRQAPILRGIPRMPEHAERDVTQWLERWSEGDREALDALTPAVYQELRRIAAAYLRRERSDHTLQPTALVHEAFIKLIDQRHMQWKNRAHFFGVAAQMMRRILVDHARARAADKRGGGRSHLLLDDAMDVAAVNQVDVLAVDDALHRLAEIDPDQVRIVELRFFGGLTIEEAAEVLGWSSGTVKREWSVARAWLHRELQRGATG